MENRNLQWNKRVKVPLILIFSVNTNHESVAYRSFRPSKFEARGARKVTTGISLQVVPDQSRSSAMHLAPGTTRGRPVLQAPERSLSCSPSGVLVRALSVPPWDGHPELACGSQAFIATLLFDPSMSALPIIPKQNSVSVGLFTHWTYGGNCPGELPGRSRGPNAPPARRPARGTRLGRDPGRRRTMRVRPAESAEGRRPRGA